MAKNNTSVIPSQFALKRLIETSPASFFGVNASGEERKIKAIQQMSLGVVSNYLANDADNISSPNPQTTQYCLLNDDENILRIKFNIKFLPLCKKSISWVILLSHAEICTPTRRIGLICCDDPELSDTDAGNDVKFSSGERDAEDETTRIRKIIGIILDDFAVQKRFFDFMIADAALLETQHHVLRDFDGIIVTQ